MLKAILFGGSLSLQVNLMVGPLPCPAEASTASCLGVSILRYQHGDLSSEWPFSVDRFSFDRYALGFVTHSCRGPKRYQLCGDRQLVELWVVTGTE